MTPHSSPIRARYVVSFVDPASDWYSASVPVIIYVISYNIGLHYNGTRLYCVYHVGPGFNKTELQITSVLNRAWCIWICLLAQSTKFDIFQNISYRIKKKNPLAQLTVLPGMGCWAMRYIMPCSKSSRGYWSSRVVSVLTHWDQRDPVVILHV